MNQAEQKKTYTERKINRWLAWPGIIVPVTLGVVVLTLAIENWQFLVQNSLFFLVLLCPLMHLFMHHGHRHSSDDKKDQ